MQNFSHWFRGIFIYALPFFSSRPPREGGRVRTFFLCDSSFVPPSPPTILELYAECRIYCSLGKALFLLSVRNAALILVCLSSFRAPKEGLWTSPMSRSEKKKRCGVFSADGRAFMNFETRIFHDGVFSGVRGRRILIMCWCLRF